MDDRSYVLLPVTPADDKDLAVIIRSSLKEFGANKPGTVYFDDSTYHLSRLFTAPRSAYFVVHERDAVAGGAGVFPTSGLPEDTCELSKMYLAPSFRGRGYGDILIHRCIEKAREFGYNYMYLETMPELKSAISLYEKTGFHFLDGPMGNSGHTGCDIWMRMEI